MTDTAPAATPAEGTPGTSMPDPASDSHESLAPDTAPAATPVADVAPDTSPAAEGISNGANSNHLDAADTVPTADTDADPDTNGGLSVDESNPALVRAVKDAKRYRLALREAEGQRDALQATLTDYHRAEAERIAESRLIDSADLWRDGVSVAELLDDDGRVDPDKVGAAVDAVIDAHEHWQRPTPQRPNVHDLHSGSTGRRPEKTGGTWMDALKGYDHPPR